jgi:hypothetical protein
VTVTQAQIIAVLDANPHLTIHGMGAPDDHLRYSSRDTEEFRRSRQDLRDFNLELLARAVDWLNAWPRTKHVNERQLSSYGLKHVFEYEAEYIENGAFILANRELQEASGKSRGCTSSAIQGTRTSTSTSARKERFKVQREEITATFGRLRKAATDCTFASKRG